MRALIFIEQEDGVAHHSAARVVTAALKLTPQVNAVVIGKDALKAAPAITSIAGIQTVFVMEDATIVFPLAETIAPLLHSHFGDYDYYLASATSTGKDCMPRLAALLDVAQLSEVTEILGTDTFKRPIYAGNAIETVKSSDKQKVITLRASSFSAAPSGGHAKIETIAVKAQNTLTECVAYQKSKAERPDLTAARVIISGGRGVGSAENFTLLERIADKLGGAVGASRAAVDAGYIPNDYQVGQTGKIVAPELYIALGISGAIQHLAGIKDSKIIVAINKDENAPIFEVADYGLVADIFQVLPELDTLL